jgi:hypothetical protein
MRFLARIILLSLLGATPALAQTDAELAKARKLYSQGLTQEAAGDWADALGSFEDVARIKLTPQVRFHVARCKQRLGRLNEALGGYRMAEYEAGNEAHGGELVNEVKKARTELEARIPKLTIVRGKDAEALKIELDGVVLGETQIGHEISVDPGPHVVTGIVAPGKRFKKEVRLAERDKQQVVLDVPEDLVAPPPAPTAAPEPSSAPTSTEPAPEHEEPPASPQPTSHGAGPYIVGGLGLASLAASGVFYALRKNAENELDNQCLGRTCPDTLRDTQSRGETYAALTGVTFAVGLAGVGAATLMLLGSSSKPGTPAAASVSLHTQGLGLRLGARF